MDSDYLFVDAKREIPKITNKFSLACSVSWSLPAQSQLGCGKVERSIFPCKLFYFSPQWGVSETNLSKIFLAALLSLTATCLLTKVAAACTRAVYLGPQDTIITVRSMDWKSDMGSNLWAFPRGMERDGAAGANSIRWKSRYGSVVTSVFDAATADGMNEKGLVANMLYLAESEYDTPTAGDKRRPLCVSAWTQYVLDNFATVNEAVEAIKQEPFYVVPVSSPDGAAGTVHLAISDVTGDSAIFEYVAGKLVIHHSRDYQVMTNSPVYDQQLALNSYWQQIGGLAMLPGTNRAVDRFVRASYYINAIPKTADMLFHVEAIAVRW